MILKSTLVAAFIVVVAALSTEPPAFATYGVRRADGNDQWVGTWSTAMHQPNPGAGLTNTGFDNQTLRQIVHTSVGGNRVRVRLSAFGANALVIGAAHVAIGEQGPAIVPGSDRPLTFGGQSSITIPPGAPVLSDAVDLDVSALSDLAVSIYVPEFTGPATWHFAAMQTSYVSPPGDFTGNTVMPVDSTRQAWFWLSGVEVMTSTQIGATVTFGDSITDSANSTPNTNNRWPDHLARRLMAQPGLKMSVLNVGMAGNQLLHEILGANALARFDADVLTQTGVTHVIVMMGNNDIGVNWPGGVRPSDEVTAVQLVQGHKQLIERAHARGLKIYGGTLTPFEGAGINLGPGGFFPYFSPANEAKRQAVNAWIRTSGEYDAAIDFDRVLRDSNSPTRLLPLYDSGDHLHPNDAGYKAMADAIDLKLFENGDNR